jgi:hypothetical protein
MGCFYELNDTLLISSKQGFPSEVLNYDRHATQPVKLEEVEGQLFHFHSKSGARAYQLHPVRVYLVEKTEQGEWLFWGKALIQSLNIEHQPGGDEASTSSVQFDPEHWQTSGTFKIIEIYDPAFQKVFTNHESPEGMSFFG